jgi:hypothetical protein
MAKKNVYSLKTVDGDPVRVEEAWKDANGELLTEKVNKADAQTITGLKTFETLPQSSATPSDDKDLATKKYSDDLWATRKAQEEKCYQALKTVTKDFTRTDPVYVRIGDDGEPEIHYTMTQANADSYFYLFNIGKNSTIYIHNAKILTSANQLFRDCTVRKIVFDFGENDDAISGFYMFMKNLGNCLEEIDIGMSHKKLTTYSNIGLFMGQSKLKEAPAFDLSTATNLTYVCYECKSMTAFHCTGMIKSFDLSSTALKHDAILEVFNNLGSEVAEGTTLTLGSAKLALMSDEEKKIATDKGWTLA